ncbi:ankyrin-1-like isoform X1 [Leptopilina heterotoma]|uniref:ankyrin-1-like isoform X1 n=1 Tax=Leptopilina heterotoma TaxID=63436 RepID=UPI001CA7D3F2|nr:ankyrin-1-like isoform X1 [Leptopilina heterotoma]XP_043461512.1 ankyrin-1-like isoform X1 [Leptopilina heterotoma]
MDKEICQSPLFLAAVKGNAEEIKEHYEATSAAPKKEDKFYFALYFACFNGRVDVVKFLLENKVDPNYVVGSYLTPLHAAILNKHNSIIEMLLNHGANVNPKIKNKSGKKTVEVNYFCSPLICAARTQNEKVIEMLLQRDSVVNTKVQSVDYNKKKSMYYRRSEPEDEYERKLIFGTFDSYNLSEEYRDSCKLGFTPLHFVLKGNKQASAQLLLDRGANINEFSKLGLTPLFLACKENDLDLVKFLLKAGADMNAQASNGENLLCYIIGCMIFDSFQDSYDEYDKQVWIDRSKVFSYLLKIGADPNGWSAKDKESVLHCAAKNGIPHIVHLLFKYGANVNSVDNELKTPIEYAVGHLQKTVQEIQDDYYCADDSYSDEDEYRNNFFGGLEDEEDYEQSREERRKEREEIREERFRNRKIYNLTHNKYTYNRFKYEKYHGNDEGYTIFKDPQPFRLVSQLFVRELVRLEALGKRNAQQNVKFLQTTFVKPYYTRCKNELKKLKKNVIADGVNYYDFLIANDDKLKEYMENENIAKKINEENCRHLFPNYTRDLKLNAKRVMKRKKSEVDEESSGSSDDDVHVGGGRAKRRRW